MLMKHYRIHIDIHKFEQIYLHGTDLMSTCLNTASTEKLGLFSSK